MDIEPTSTDDSSRIANLEREIEDLNADLQRLRAELEEQTEQAEAAQERADELEEENQQLRDKLELWRQTDNRSNVATDDNPFDGGIYFVTGTHIL